MKIRVLWILRALLGIISLTACGPGDVFEDSSEKATREAQDVLYQQTLMFVGTHAATIAALQSTADGAAVMGTQIVRLNSQNQALQATLDTLASGGQTTILQPQPPAAQPDGQLAPSSNSQLFPNVATPTPAQSNGTVYLEANTAITISDDDGCPVEVSSTFQRDTERIYMVVKAQNVRAGVTYYTRWLYDGQPRFETVRWTPEQPFAEVCIWFYITPADITFVPGNWSVQLVANELATISRSFQIAGGEPTSTPIGFTEPAFPEVTDAVDG